MSEPVLIVVTVAGGMVTDVHTMGIPVRVLIVDHDADGADPDAGDVVEIDGAAVVVSVSDAEPVPPEMVATYGDLFAEFGSD